MGRLLREARQEQADEEARWRRESDPPRPLPLTTLAHAHDRLPRRLAWRQWWRRFQESPTWYGVCFVAIVLGWATFAVLAAVGLIALLETWVLP